jgi:hypothetical protein
MQGANDCATHQIKYGGAHFGALIRRCNYILLFKPQEMLRSL